MKDDLIIGIAIFIFATFFTSSLFNETNYRKSFDKIIECRQNVKSSTELDVVCGKIPQWSDFVKN